MATTVYMLELDDWEGPPLLIDDDDVVAVGSAIANLCEAAGYSPEEVKRPEGTDPIRWNDWLITLVQTPWMDGVSLEYAEILSAARLQEHVEEFGEELLPRRRSTEDVVVAGGVL